jgi:hypothetical protein
VLRRAWCLFEIWSTVRLRGCELVHFVTRGAFRATQGSELGLLFTGPRGKGGGGGEGAAPRRAALAPRPCTSN